jgi:DNA gyrase inhibitor GyrI
VQLLAVPPQKVAVLRFSGRWTEANLREHVEALRAAVKDAGLTAVGEPVMAFYNPPCSLPFLRRNEIMLELGDTDRPSEP